MVEHWIGSDHTNKTELISLITELVNEEYKIEEFKSDILDLWGEDDENN
jgi:hypothetical protein